MGQLQEETSQPEPSAPAGPALSPTGVPPAEIAALIDALGTAAATDLHVLFGPALLDRTRGLVRLSNMIGAELARTVRIAECSQAPECDGLKSMASWLRGHGNLSPAEASAVVRGGRTGEQLPAVAAAWAQGAVTAGQVAAMAPVITPARVAAAAERGADLGEVADTLVAVATGAQPGNLPAVVHRFVAWLEPDGPQPDPTQGRRFHLSRHGDGSGTCNGNLDALGAEKVAVTLEAMIQAGRCAGDQRTRAQQTADALVQLCDNALASGTLPFLRSNKPQITANIDLEDILDPDLIPAAATLGSGAVISNAAARAAACDGSIIRIVFGPEGQPVNLGRSTRFVPAYLRRALDVRDRGCVFAGCGAPTWWCDGHHLLEWIADEGPTNIDNLALVCERHHTKVHAGFSLARDTTGTWHTYRPDGTEIITGPRPPRPPGTVARPPKPGTIWIGQTSGAPPEPLLIPV